MVQAILAGRKTQTRRVVKPQPESVNVETPIPIDQFLKKLKDMTDKGLEHVKSGANGLAFPKCPYGQPGDVLWVRETWCVGKGYDDVPPSEIPLNIPSIRRHYMADGAKPEWAGKTRTSIHMPKDACRLFLRITNVRVERLQEISDDDACEEGIDVKTIQNADAGDYSCYPRNYMISEKEADGWPYLKEEQYVESFQSLWKSINGEESWNENPFVWVLEFEQIEKPQKP